VDELIGDAIEVRFHVFNLPPKELVGNRAQGLKLYRAWGKRSLGSLENERVCGVGRGFLRRLSCDSLISWLPEECVCKANLPSFPLSEWATILAGGLLRLTSARKYKPVPIRIAKNRAGSPMLCLGILREGCAFGFHDRRRCKDVIAPE
jgi:hypothetical protein